MAFSIHSKDIDDGYPSKLNCVPSSHQGTKQSDSDYEVKGLISLRHGTEDDSHLNVIQQCIAQILSYYGDEDEDGVKHTAGGTGTVFKRLENDYYLVLTCAHNLVRTNEDNDTKERAQKIWFLSKGVQKKHEKKRLLCIDWVAHEDYAPKMTHCPDDIGIMLCYDAHGLYRNVKINSCIRLDSYKGKKKVLKDCHIEGYPATKGQLMGMSGPVELHKDLGEWKYAKLYTFPGQSGSLIYKLRDDDDEEEEQYYIYGVHTYGNTSTQKNRGVYLSKKHIQWIQNKGEIMKQRATDDLHIRLEKRSEEKTDEEQHTNEVQAVQQFLESLDITDCYSILETNGCKSMDDLRDLNHSVLEGFGINKFFERKRLLDGTKQYFGLTNVHSQKEVIKIVIAKEEEEATDKLVKYSEDILNLKQQITRSYELLNKNVEECNKDIQVSFDDLLNKINAKKQEIEGNLKGIEQRGRSAIDGKSQVINTEQQKVQSTKKKCVELQEDDAVDRTKRKHDIVSMVDDIMKYKLSKNIGTINTEITFECSIDNMSVHIYAKQHPIPIIDNIRCKSMTKTTANIYFNAKLSNEDKNRKITSDLYMKLESFKDDVDEKKEQKTSDIAPILLIKFDKNKEKYKFELKNLEQNTTYVMYINLYESGSDKQMMLLMHKLAGIDAILVTFTTTMPYQIDKIFTYQSDFDTNGICYAMGANYGQSFRGIRSKLSSVIGQKQWSNPVSQGLITMKSSGWGYGKVEEIVGREQEPSYCCSTSNQNAWFSVDFGAKLKIKPAHYTLRHDQNKAYYLRTWNFEGSNDGNNWSVLKQHKNDKSLNGRFASHTWRVEGNGRYQMFRIYMMGENSAGQWKLMCSGFEIFGHLAGFK